MKKINFRKFGILLVMMLVCGMFIVGSASAFNESPFNENLGLSDNGYYWIYASGNLIASDYLSYSGGAFLKDEGIADSIYLKVSVYSNNVLVSSHTSIDYDTDSNLEFSAVYDYSPYEFINPYITTRMIAENPDDSGTITIYLI